MVRLGIDIGGTSVKAALIDGAGAVRTALSAAYARPDRATLRDAVSDAVAGVGGADADAVGLCVPGRRSPDGAQIDLSVNLPGLERYRFETLLADALGRDVAWTAMGDAEAGVLDAARDHPGARRVLGLSIGTGVGACLLEGGRPLRIGSAGIGHFGQIDVGPVRAADEGPVGPDGGRNGLEAFVGAAALRARWGDAAERRLGTVDAGDPVVVALARAVRIGLAIYAPDLVLLLGGTALALAPRAGVLDAAIRADLTRVAPEGWRLAFGTSRFHAALGAARAAAPGATGQRARG